MQELQTIKHLEINTCIMCGEELHSPDKVRDVRCDFCGEVKSVFTECTNTHCLCKDCMALTPVEFVKSMCLKYKGIDPIELAVDIMNSPVIKMHGAEHHFIVPAVLLTCLHNLQQSTESLADKIAIVERRAALETPDKCSYNLATCGAAIGTGVFLSVYLHRELADEDEWSMSNVIVAESLKKVAESGGPRCCKRDTYLSLSTAANFIRERFALELPLSQAKCTFSLRNKTCKHEECEFYNLSNSLV